MEFPLLTFCKISCASANVKQAYENLCRCTPPNSKTRCRVDICDAVSNKILEHTSIYLKAKENVGVQTEHVDWPVTGSLFSSAVSQTNKTRSQRLSSVSGPSLKSRQSSLSSLRKQDAAAELAATQVSLKVLQEIECEQQALETLEKEDRGRIVLQQVENAARKKNVGREA